MKETHKKKYEILKEKNEPDMELQSQYLIEDKEWKFCKYRGSSARNCVNW